MESVEYTMENVLQALPAKMLKNFVRRYEAGGVQPRPRLRFVDAEGRACPAAALAGARTGAELLESRAGRRFRGSPLEAVSRRFEAGELSAASLYRECLLERARRRRRARPSADRPARAHASRRPVGNPLGGSALRAPSGAARIPGEGEADRAWSNRDDAADAPTPP